MFRAARWMVLGALGGMTGCQVQVSQEVLDLSGLDVTRLDVSSVSGAVTVTAGETLAVERSAESGVPGFEFRHNERDGVLTLEERCPLPRTCAVTTTITMPAHLDLSVDLRSGQVNLEGLSGSVDITGEGLTVSGAALRSSALTMNIDNGTVALELEDPPREVFIWVGSGEVNLNVPAGVYLLDVEAPLGELRLVNVVHDPASDLTLSAVVDVGDLAVEGEVLTAE
ncbi:MAG: hypothetical protein IPO67_01230 [Deltaproteobacteria bacterium]|jgi:hypothetical protein|nr:hypothetical protein [Deltaproteobacteria bacterium]MBK9643777.1 hypothetical protein [Deltaproteobacteria bacterium]